MSDNDMLFVEQRERVGKGSARAARRAGLVPAVIYGNKQPSRAVTIEKKALNKEINRGGFLSKLFTLQMGSRKQQVLPRDIHFHPVTGDVEHIDFLRLADDSTLTIAVPVVFLNEEECAGLRRGGVLNVVRYEVEVSCRADAIPQQIEIDLADLDIGDSVHISAVTLPDGVTPTITDRDFTIATIASPTVATEEDEDAEAADGMEAGDPDAPAEAEAEETES